MLAVYRLAFGQPRQEDLLSYLSHHGWHGSAGGEYLAPYQPGSCAIAIRLSRGSHVRANCTSAAVPTIPIEVLSARIYPPGCAWPWCGAVLLRSHWPDLGELTEKLEQSADALDAVVCAFAAKAVGAGHPLSYAEDAAAAEGLIPVASG